MHYSFEQYLMSHGVFIKQFTFTSPRTARELERKMMLNHLQCMYPYAEEF